MGPSSIRLLEELLTEVQLPKQGLRILDLGSGHGLNALYFAKEHQATVFATDLWISATDNYERFKGWGMEEHIIPIHADVHDLPFANGYFDVIVCIDAYHYFGSSEGFFEEKILNLLKPGGYVLIAMPGLKQPFQDQEPELMKEWCGDEISFFLTVEKWQALIKPSEQIQSLQIKEMGCFEVAWQDWFETKHEFALRDEQFLNNGLREYLNFVSIIVKKADK